MKRFLKLFGILAAFTLCLVGMSPAGSAAGLFGIGGGDDEPQVKFEVTDIVLKGDKIKFTGKFVNETDAFQRVTALKLHYIITDEESSPILTGGYEISGLETDVAAEPVPFSFEVKDTMAEQYNTYDIVSWRIMAKTKLEQ